jgi:hypothetical protein
VRRSSTHSFAPQDDAGSKTGSLFRRSLTHGEDSLHEDRSHDLQDDAIESRAMPKEAIAQKAVEEERLAYNADEDGVGRDDLGNRDRKEMALV